MKDKDICWANGREPVACQNTDREIWRKRPGDFYSPSVHVTQGGGIGINCGGHVLVAPVEKWHQAGEVCMCVNEQVPSWRWRLAMWLLDYPYKVRAPKC